MEGKRKSLSKIALVGIRQHDQGRMYMKRLVVPFFIFLLAVNYTYGSSCESLEDEKSYFITAAIGDNYYTWNLGIADVETRPFGQQYSGSIPGVEFFATSENVTRASALPANYVWFDIATFSASTGVYTYVEVYGWIRLQGTYWIFKGVTLEIKAFGDVGGSIDGTFSGIVSDGLTTQLVTNGSFSLMRIPNDTW